MKKFILFGVPRSGTTILAELLNLSPEVFCAIERFPVEHFRSSYLTQAGVFNETICRFANYERNRSLLESKKAPLCAFGNKTPRLFYLLPQILAEEFPPQALLIVRNQADVCHSWDSRSGDVKDATWHRGQDGLFAILDYVSLILALSAIPAGRSILAVSFEALFYENDESLLELIFKRLGATEKGPALDQFRAQTSARERLRHRERPIPPLQQDVINQFGPDTLWDSLVQEKIILDLDAQHEVIQRCRKSLESQGHLIAERIASGIRTPSHRDYLNILRKHFALDVRTNPVKWLHAHLSNADTFGGSTHE